MQVNLKVGRLGIYSSWYGRAQHDPNKCASLNTECGHWSAAAAKIGEPSLQRTTGMCVHELAPPLFQVWTVSH